MTVKELKEVLQPLYDDLPVKMLSLREDNINDSFNISHIVLVTPLTADSVDYENEVVIIPE